MNKIMVVGIGPGAPEEMTLRAADALKRARVIVGYSAYVDLIRPMFPDKEYITTLMRREARRCRMAIDAALQGQTVAVISSGDAGVYGMAGLMLEMAEGTGLEIEVVPGVTAALSGAALLGAPLGHDFAVISLSDALTERGVIERRLEMAARADLCMAIYNPASHRRPDGLAWACGILLRHLAADTVCALVKNIAREGQQMRVMTLEALGRAPADMFTTAFVGNSRTRVVDGRMVTPRGYRYERDSDLCGNG